MSYLDIRKKYGLTTDDSEDESNKRKVKYSDIAKKHGISYEADEDYINLFMKDANEYIKTAQKDLEGLSWGNVSDVQNSTKTRLGDISARSNNIRGWLTSNRSKVSEDTYNELLSSLDTVDRSISSIIDHVDNAKKHYSKWETEDDYNSAVKAQKDYEDMLNFDLESSKSEISDIESQLTEAINKRGKLNQQITAYSRSNEGKKAKQLRKQRDQIDDTIASLKATLSQKKQYYTLAERAQSAVALTDEALNAPDLEKYSNIGNEAGEMPSNWDRLWGAKWNAVANLRNNPEALEAYETSAKSANGASWGTAERVLEGQVEYLAAKYMKDDEFKIYNYYYAKDIENGTDNAVKYLESIEDTLNQRAATEKFGDIEGNVFLEMVFGVEAGLAQFEEGVANLFSNEDYIPTSSTQYASAMVREDLEDAGFKLPDWMGGASIGQVGYDLTTTTANMLPSILVSTIPVVGEYAGATLLGASAAGNAKAEMLRLGYSKEQANTYGLLVGASEGVLQYALGGISKLGGKLSGNAVSKFVSKFDNAIARTAIKVGGNMASEGLEEALQSILEPYFKSVATGEDLEAINWEEVIYSGLLGMITAGVLEGPSTIAGEIGTYKAGKNIKADTDALNRLTKLGSTMSADSVAYKLASKIDENTGAYTIGRLLNEVGASLTEANMSDIVKSLERKGMRTEDAQTISKWLSKVVEGKTFSNKQVKILESNDVVATTLVDVLLNNNSTVWQRMNGYEQLRELANSKASAKNSSAQATEATPVTENPIAEENATEGKFAVSESGKTTYNGNEVSIKDIASIENGEAVLLLDNGETVNARDVEFSNEDEGLIYEAIVDMDIDRARDFIQGFTTSKNAPLATQQTSESYILGFNEAYGYGRYGIPESVLERDGTYSKSLSGGQRKIAYNRGAIDAKSQVTAKQEAINEAVANAKSNESKSKGKVTYDKSIRGTLAKGSKEAESVKLIEFFNTHFSHAKIRIYASYVDENGRRVFKDTDGKVKPAPNGKYMADGSIALDLNSGEKGEGLILYSFSHELTHMAKRLSPEKYKAYADFLFKHYGENRSVEQLISYEIDFAKKKGRKLSRENAYDEAVARASERMLVDVLNGTAQSKLAELNTKHKDIFEKIKEFFAKLVASIKEWYKDTPSWSDSANIVHDMQDVAEQLQAMWLDMVTDAGKVNSALGGDTTSLLKSSNLVNLDTKTESIAPTMNSERTWTASEYVTERENTAKEISKALGVSLETAYKYIDDINSVARLIADDRARLDYEPNLDDKATVLKPNSEYKFSVDMSTLCAKRLLFTGTFDAIQRELPNMVFDSEDIVSLREMMQKRGYEVACGICYVESTRREIGQITQDFINSYKESQKTGKPITRLNSEGKAVELKKTKDQKETTADKSTDKYFAEKDYTPTLADLNTTDIDLVKRDHPLVYEAYLNFMNARGQAKPKLLETRAEYKGEILKHFKAKSAVNARNNSGGLRLQSFSDFEVPHLIDMMQIVMDMSRVGLKSQAYTKVPAFAEVFGDTGVKINLSLIAKGDGLDANGNLIFDDVEGINHKEAFKLRDKYSKNVGTILVGKTDAHIIAAMADPRIDYIIPFHKSSWKESLYDALGLTGYENYTDFQNEKPIDKDRKIKNYDPSEYWDFSKSGDENAQIYLQKCREDGRIPKFPQFQGYPGYWKLLIDFKMYDNNGVGSPQEVVKPTFNTEASERILREYKGGHRSFPVAKDVVEDFVKEHRTANLKEDTTMYSDRDSYAPTFYSQMGKVIDDIKMDKIGATSIVNFLKGKGIRNDEIKWSGIEAWLEGKKSVTKAELQEFVAGSQLVIEEELSEEVRWSQYKLDGGTNYRELVFKMPDSSYSNRAMRGHWGQDAEGILVHARIQDFDVNGKKMLFIEELQSDWHNEGMEKGYTTEEYEDAIATYDSLAKDYANKRKAFNQYVRSSEFRSDPDDVSKKKFNWLRGKMDTAEKRMQEAERYIDSLKKKGMGDVPDAPFRETYHEYVLKRLLRMATEEGYDSIGWTPADIQSQRWSYDYEKAYKIEYDQEMPKFLRKYGKRWGATVGKTMLDQGWSKKYAEEIARQKKHIEDWENNLAKEISDSAKDFIREQIKYHEGQIKAMQVNGETVWSMDITDSMTESVLYEGQVMYSDRVTDKNTLNFLENQEHITTYKSFVEIDGKLYSPMATKVKGDDGKYRLTNPSELGVWQQAEEKPDSIPKFHKSGYGYYVLKKDDGGSVTAAYNPYEHSSNLVLNDQFESAYQRPNLVTVECIIPKSEMTSGYKAKYAKDSTGYLDWKSGIVAGKLKGNKRKVYLSRWLKPVRIVSDAEVASMYKDILGTNISVPFNVVPPQLLTELEKVGVKIDYEGSPGYQYRQSKKKTDDSTMYSERDDNSVSNRSLLANALESVAQNEIEKNKLKEYKSKIDIIEAEQKKLADLRAKIKELSFAKGTRDTAQIKKLQSEATISANRINTYDRQLLNLESTTALKNVLAREKEMVRKRTEQKGKEAMAKLREREAEKTRILLNRASESRKKGIEGRKKTEMRHKVKDIVSDLNKLLLNPTKDQHVPIGLQLPVAQALAVVNMDTVGAEERIKALQDELMRAKTPEKAQEIAKKIEYYQNMGGRIDARLSALKTAYDNIVNSEDPLVANAHDEVISQMIAKVQEDVGSTPIRDMSLSQLEEVYDLFKAVLTTIRNANKSFKGAQKERYDTLASRVMEEIDTLGIKRKPLPRNENGKEKGGLRKGKESFAWNNQKPIYAFEQIGSNTLTGLYKNVRAGEDTWAQDVQEARVFFTSTRNKYGYDSWDLSETFTFKSTTGKEFEISLDMIMSLYAYSKRGKQAVDHITNGGIVLDDGTGNATSYKISDETLSEIIAKVTSNTELKAFVDEMQEYLSSVMGEKGNEVALELYGIKLFKEKFYFPLKSSPIYMAKSREQDQTKGEVKIKNYGITKETKEGAKNPIILSSFVDVWANHVNEMSMYHAFVLPMEDFYRVFNYHTPYSHETEAVRAYIQNAYGDSAVSYVDQLLKDLNGGAVSDPREGFAKGLMTKFKKAKTMLSLSVIVQQPTSVVRAMALVDAKYFTGKPSKRKHSETWAEVKKYAPVAIIKEMGYFDTNMGRSATDYITGQEYRGIKDKAKALVKDGDYRDEAFSKLPALADEFAWCSIWNAVKREVVHTHPNLTPNSEEFLKVVGERFTEVITRTQVYDSTLSRSGWMRSKSGLVNMWTAFLGEPTTSINMFGNAILNIKRGNKKMGAKAIGGVLGAVVFNAALVSLVYAMRDDDEDETYIEKYLSRLSTELLEGVNPLTYIPFVKDIWSITQGYDVERTDMSLISDLWSSFEKVITVLAKDTEDMDEKEFEEHQKEIGESLWGIVGSISSLTGLPVENISRDIKGVINLIGTIGNDATERDTSWSSLGDEVWEDVKDSIPVIGKLPDESKTDKLYDAIVNGDDAYRERLESGYDTKSKLDSAIRKALRENDSRIKEAALARYNGNTAEYMRIAKEIIAEGYFSQDNIVAAINAEVNALNKGESTATAPESNKAESIFKMDDYYAAIVGRDQATAYKVKEDIISIAVANGKDRDEAEKNFDSSFSSYLREQYELGELSEYEAQNMLVTYGGKSYEEAESKVQYWEFKQEYPDIDLSEEAVKKYFEEVEPYGISINVYHDYSKQRAKCKGTDSDGDGKTDSGSVKSEVMQVIDSLPISSAQKDALYYLNGWAESKLYEAPWH